MAMYRSAKLLLVASTSVVVIWILVWYSVKSPAARRRRPSIKDTQDYQSAAAPLDKQPRSFINLSWVTLPDPRLHDAFLFISAYYDSRKHARMNRPAVSVVTYVLELPSKPKLMCHFTYANGTSVCLGEAKHEVVDHFLLQRKIHNIKKPISELLLCPVREGDPLPTVVRFSTTNDCKQSNLSGEIMVRNYNTLSNKTGVCIQGSLRQNGLNFLTKLDDFIAMTKTLGADFVTMYASPEEVQEEVIQHLLTNHTSTVNLVQWKKFSSDDYHGQGGIMLDCLYRHMWTTDYLVLIDLDEMILPFRHLKWIDMLKELEHKAGKEYAGYSFQNRFFLPRNDGQTSVPTQQCSVAGKRPFYLERTNELQCLFRHKERSKYIIKPKLVVHPAVHELCEALSPYLLFPVNSKVAVSAHYKEAKLERCVKAKSIDKYKTLSPLLELYADNYCA